MAKTKIDVSIIIPAKNEETNITACLDAIFKQDAGCKFEIIVIDSGSTDRTVDLVKQYPQVKLITIEPAEFGHGKTRNLGAGLAAGDYIVFLNADALPVDNNWLNSLIRHFEDEKNKKIAGVFSRHIPKQNCDLYMARDILKSMPARGYIKSAYKKFDFMIFSTVSCALSREIWREFPFKDDIVIAEDQEWARQALYNGFHIVYEPGSTVYHSHNFKLRELYTIKKKIGRTEHKFKNRFFALITGLPLVIGGALVKISGDIFFILFKSKSLAHHHNKTKRITFSAKLKQIRIAAAARSAGFWGRYIGWIGDKND
jgi:rhamnosyltransferase